MKLQCGTVFLMGYVAVNELLILVFGQFLVQSLVTATGQLLIFFISKAKDTKCPLKLKNISETALKGWELLLKLYVGAFVT